MRLKEVGKKKILFYCGHPAHFHLLKNPYLSLKEIGYEVHMAIKPKDTLEDLLKISGIEYFKMSNISSTNRILKYVDSLCRLIKYCFFIKRSRYSLLVGTSWENAKIGKLLHIPSICLNEDDAKVVPLFSLNAYPGSSVILSPISCDNGKYEMRSIKYHSFHELAYLHPNYFKPNYKILKKYNLILKQYSILRFSDLSAHHDRGKEGISFDLAIKLVKILQKNGDVIITSERPLIKELEKYRLEISPIDIHHIMCFANIYIGDSQTMAAESGILGIPFIRFNDFVGKLGYLQELEEKYQLGYGIKTNDPEKLLNQVIQLSKMQNLSEVFQKRRKKMLSEKIDYAKFLTWFIDKYPESYHIMKSNPKFQFQFF